MSQCGVGALCGQGPGARGTDHAACSRWGSEIRRGDSEPAKAKCKTDDGCGGGGGYRHLDPLSREVFGKGRKERLKASAGGRWARGRLPAGVEVGKAEARGAWGAQSREGGLGRVAEGSWGTDGPSGDCRTETAQRTNTRGCCDSQRGSQKWQGARVKGGSREASRQSQGVRVLTGKASVRVPSAGLSVTDVQMSARLVLLPPSPGKWLGERQGGAAGTASGARASPPHCERRRHTLSRAALRPHHIADREDTGGGPKGSSPKDTPKS